MVRLAAPVAINRDDSAPDSQTGETAEVLERRIQAEYDEALEQERTGNKAEAQALFKQLLAEPALQSITSGSVTTLAHARYLVLKNLAGSLAHDDATCQEALHLYVEASELDASDTVLWHRLGSLASELGQWSLARHALESGLRCSPQHYLIQNKLLEVLLELADWQSTSALLCMMLEQNSANLRAVKVWSTLQSQQQPSQQKWLVLSDGRLVLSDGTAQQEDDLALQPQLKRRCISSQDSNAQPHPPQHCIALQCLTWQSLIKALCIGLVDAVSKGLPGACKVVFAMPKVEGTGSEVDMVLSPSAAEIDSTHAAVSSLQLNLTEADDAAKQESADDTEAEGKQRAEVVPVVTQRASRRSATEAGSDHESPEPAKNVVELLAPFLAAQPADASSQPTTHADTTNGIPTQSAAGPLVSPQAEQVEVQKFVDQQQANSGLYAVASDLLERLLSTEVMRLPSEVLEDAMRLEAAVQGWQRSTVVALTLAELYYQALIKEEPSNPADEDNKSNAKRAAKASSSRIDQLMASCMAHMGMFEAVLLQQQANTSASASYSHIIQSSSDSAVALTLELSSQDNTAALSTSDDAPATASHKHDADVYQLLARYHWLGGCLSEHLKHFEDASQQYEACKVALAVLSSSCDTAQATSFTLARGVTISAPLVESRLETLKMVMIVEDGRRCLDEGRHEELVSRLTPVLLTANTSHLPLNVPQQLAGLDLIKEAASGPQAWQTKLHCLLAAASIQLPVYPAAISSQQDQQAPCLVLPPTMLAVITTLADELQKQLPAWENNSQAGGYSQAVGLRALLARLQWQLLGLVQGLYASLAATASNSPPRRSLDVKDQQQQKGLLQALQLLWTLRKLDTSIPDSPEGQLQLLSTGASLLVDAGILGLAGGMYLKTCLAGFAPHFVECTRCTGGVLDDESCSPLVGAAAQCIYLLYGLDLTERNEQWTDGFQGKADSPDPQSQEEAVLLWTYIVHFCGSLTNRSKSFKSRLKELLTAIHAQVAPPPHAVLVHFDLDALLDNTASPIPTSLAPTLSSGPTAPLPHHPPHQPAQSSAITTASAAAEAACAGLNTEALAAAVSQDPDAGLHAELYRMLAQCEPDVFERLSESQLMQQQGHEQIVEYLQLTRFDLCYHPWRYESWERVLNVYATASSTLSNAAVEQAMTAEQWWQSDLHHRYSLYCDRALAAIQYARLAAGNITDTKERADTIVFLEEQKGTLFLEQIQDAPPLYNQMQNSPKSVDPQYRQKCLAGLEAFQHAQLTLDEEWEFQLCIAKLLRKLGADSEQVLHHLAKACHLAKQFAGGSVESMYQLHATRLKLLQASQPNLAILQRHCFLKDTRGQMALTTASYQSGPHQAMSSADATSAAGMSSSNAVIPDKERVAIVFQDAMSAMEYCLEQSKRGQYETFHKARYRRAQALRWRGQQAQALAELQPCFKSRSKQGFAINMFVIPEGVKKATKAYAASDNLEMEEQAQADQPQPAVPEELWGQTVDALSVNGVEETSRKFYAHVRRALILYVLLLKDTGDLDALRGIINALRGREFGSYSDLCRWAFGMYVIHLASALQHLCLPTVDSAHGIASLQQKGASQALLLAGSSYQDSRMATEHDLDAQALSQAAGSQDPMAASAASLVPSEPAAPVAAAAVELVEKAFQVYQETCLSSDPQSCWEHVVEPALHAALTFQAPNTIALLGDAAISPEMFHKYALAYIHSLGASSSLNKLHDIQQRTKRQMRRSNAAVEACQSLHTSAIVAEQVALDKELGQLESQAQEALQSTSSKPANDVTAGEPVAEAPMRLTAPDAVALDASFDIQPAANPQTDEQAQPEQSALQEIEAAEASGQPEAMQSSGQAQCMQASKSVPGPASAEITHKELLLALLVLLKRCHALWKILGAKADAVRGPARQAELQMSRAYMAYLRLLWPNKPAQAIQGTAAANAVEHLLQQARSGTVIPEPAEQ